MSHSKTVEGWPFSFVDTVRYGDLDANRHLNNVTFLQFFESARIAYVATLAPDHDPTDPDDFGLIFAEAHINYRSPAFYEEDIRTWIRPFALRRSSFRMAFRMVSEADGRLLAEGWGALVGYDYARGSAIPLTDTLTAALRRAGAVDVDLTAELQQGPTEESTITTPDPEA
ncbi:MAG: acyl-CoA thioesterase [Solirubrobacterales bacterium]|nr:acyl-CoA thioesterase [Solirubrobacterales bacterium]